MSPVMESDPKRSGSDTLDTATDPNSPSILGAATDGESTYGSGDTLAGKGVAKSRCLPQLHDYNLKVSWAVYVGTFLFSAIRLGFCNVVTVSGIDDEESLLNVTAMAVRSFGITLSAFWICQTLCGPRCRSQLIIIFAVWATLVYAVAFAFSPKLASLAIVPNVLLALLLGIVWSQRRCFALMLMMCALAVQVMLLFTTTNLPLIQSTLPVALRQFLVPSIKTFYLSFVTEVFTFAWKKMYQRPCSPYVLTMALMTALVSAETMGVVGLLAAVDSGNIWSNAAVFCATTIVMETNSRSGILISWLFKVMGKKYRFSDAAHIFRWGKMWSSYSWLCAFSSFVVPALVFGLRVEGSNFTFLSWEPWALLGIYVVQQMVTDFIYIYLQHYIRPSPSLSETAARCLVLGEATPFFGENEHLGADGKLQTPESPVEDVFEPAGFNVGRWKIPVEALLMFLWFEYTMSVFNNYVRGQFCVYGTFLPSEVGSCD